MTGICSSPGAESQIRLAAEIGVSQTFRGPRAPRSREIPASPYVLNPSDVAGLTANYEDADHNVMALESERDELRQRMKLWMQAQGLDTWGDFSFSAPRERWKVDLRALAGVFTHEGIQITFPQRLWLAFKESELERLIATGETKQSEVLRWLPRALSVGPEAQESRDWGDAGESGQAAED